MTIAPANGTSPDWASNLANDLARLTRGTSKLEVEPGASGPPAEAPGVPGVLLEVLAEIKALRQAVERQAELQGRLARVQMAGVPILLDKGEIALSLGVSEREVDRYRKRGVLPDDGDVRIGKSTKWLPATLNRALDVLARCKPTEVDGQVVRMNEARALKGRRAK